MASIRIALGTGRWQAEFVADVDGQGPLLPVPLLCDPAEDDFQTDDDS